MLPRKSQWYLYFIEGPDLNNPIFLKSFRTQFRIPYTSFIELVQEIKDDESGIFSSWVNGDDDSPTSDRLKPKKSKIPIELLILVCLRYLGRGWTFHCGADETGISRETTRRFFHAFIQWGSTVFYKKHVKPPTTAEEAADGTAEYAEAGFVGAVGSTDATHVLHERICYAGRQSHSGYKMPGTTRSYNLTVNHRRKILMSTSGSPGRWNDKTLIKYDTFVRGIYEGDHLDKVEFELLERDNDRNVHKVKYRGAWVLVDNGYLAWPTTVPPFKSTVSTKELRWSKWLESMRKDVECTFGILKGRWRVLKSGIRTHGSVSADQTWFTCCALHNWLLEIDGLDGEWEGALGMVDEEDVARYIPAAMRRLTTATTDGTVEAANPAPYDTSIIGQSAGMEDEDMIGIEDSTVEGDVGASGMLLEQGYDRDLSLVRAVRHLRLKYFREKLIEHFDVCYENKTIRWPSNSTRA
jgi:DDE superfamily endonuclease